MRMHARIPARCKALGVLTMVATAGGCHPDPIHPSFHPEPRAGSYTVYNDTLLPSDSAYVASIRAVGLATTWETGHARTDMRRLIIGPCAGGTCSVGPLVQIIAASNAHQGSRAGLAAGKLVAKIVTVPMSANAVAYPKFALDAGGTSYVFVDSSAAHGRWRMIFVPASASSPLVGRWRETWPYEVEWSKRERRARAKFLWNDNDDEAWVTCKDMGCCAPPRMMSSSTAISEVGF